MFQNDLIHAMEAMGLVLEDYQIRQFCRFEELLLETNKVMNLTAITDPGEVAVKHMADSLSCYDERYFPKDASLLDLGTGAGFPGIPLAIFRPDLTVTFFDSLQKRLNFLNEVCRETGLRKVAFLHGRTPAGATARHPRAPSLPSPGWPRTLNPTRPRGRSWRAARPAGRWPAFPFSVNGRCLTCGTMAYSLLLKERNMRKKSKRLPMPCAYWEGYWKKSAR